MLTLAVSKYGAMVWVREAIYERSDTRAGASGEGDRASASGVRVRPTAFAMCPRPKSPSGESVVCAAGGNVVGARGRGGRRMSSRGKLNACQLLQSARLGAQ